jgi:ubiquinone biosynthesis O-methyltransferase
MSGQASIDKVAGPVGEALIMTAIGLAVAVPAVLGYNWLVRRNKAVMEEVRTSYYLRLRAFDKPGVLAEITRILADGGISIDAMMQKEPSEGEEQVDIIMLTHVTPEKNINTAAPHAAETGLAIDYRATTAEVLAATGAQFDIILNMEVIEHVADVPLFLSACSRMLKPGGLMVIATLNRTAKAFALAIVGAEYVLGWLPRGTHDWRKFLRPSEIAAELAANGLALGQIDGVSYNPLREQWLLSRDTAVNYVLTAVKPL